jgi:hypothetical protein
VNKAFEYEVRFGKDGKLALRRWSIGPVLIIGAIVIVLALTGKAVPGFLWSLFK